MSRLRRVEYPGAYYHVMARGNNQQDIFLDDLDRRIFLKKLGECAAAYNLQVFSFCLMNNHYHLFLRTPEPNLSRAMHWLGGTYTQMFNYRHQRGGHVFRGRYHAVLVEDQGHWLHLSAYIHLNPFRAGLVKSPEDWEWSSYRDYINADNRFEWLDPSPVLVPLSPNQSLRHRLYRKNIGILAGEPKTFWLEFREEIFAARRQGPPAKAADIAPMNEAKRGNLPSSVGMKEEFERICRELKLSPEDIAGGQRNRHRPLIYFRLIKECHFTGTEVARFFGVTSAAVSLGLKKVGSGPLS